MTGLRRLEAMAGEGDTELIACRQEAESEEGKGEGLGARRIH